MISEYIYGNKAHVQGNTLRIIQENIDISVIKRDLTYTDINLYLKNAGKRLMSKT